MLDTFYLPKDAVNYINFPELRTYKKDIEAIMTYAMRVNTAVANYNEAKYDKIDLNADELQSNIDLCRTVSEVLGTAPNVCYDILIELRNIQMNLQNLFFIRRRYGNKTIGTPTVTNDGSEI